MRHISRQQLLYRSNSALKNFRKEVRRRRRKQAFRIGWLKYVADIKRKCRETKAEFRAPSFQDHRYASSLPARPAYSPAIQHLASIDNVFGKDTGVDKEDGYFVIPEVFSLTEEYAKSFAFLKRLFHALYNESVEQIILDYQLCRQIDVDASVCMDIMLNDFITYYKHCRKKGHHNKIREIFPINHTKPHILKILFSIGAYSNIKGININFPDIIPYRLCMADNSHPHASSIREVDITNMVDYVIKCMSKMKRTLTAEAEKNLFEVIGEVLINAEEHSSTRHRYSIGYFQDSGNDSKHIGTFNLVILNFGKTIYEKFSDPHCPNQAAVLEMKDLSDTYTKRKFFAKAEFEEETLWTLYSLQQGVTSKADWRRGNGSIAFIESFFELKGDQEKDNHSYLSILSGNTRIKFDGTYRTKEVVKGKGKKTFKMMTFNPTGDITQKPDKKYVTFAETYFPGTIISAKISIKENNTEAAQHEQH